MYSYKLGDCCGVRGVDVLWRSGVKTSMIVLHNGRRTSGRENAVMEDRKHRVILEDYILSDASGSLTLAWAINLPRL